MKKILFYLTLAACLCWGCTENLQPVEETPTPDEKPVSGTHMATLSVGLESDAGGTKGTFVNDKFQWQAGDQIGVYMYSTTLQNVPGSYGVEGEYGPWIAPFDLQSGAGTPSGVFAKELNDALGECYGNVAIYPYTVTIDDNGNRHTSSYAYADDETKGTLTFHLPAVYKDLDNFDMVRIPMVAVLDMSAEGLKKSFTLKHVGGAVKITLKDVPAGAKYFKLWAEDGKNLSGDYTIALSQVGSGTLQGPNTGQDDVYGNSVELQLKEGKAASTLDVYFPVPAGTYKLGIGVYGDGIVYLEQVASRENTINRGNILAMPAITIPAPYLGEYDPNLANSLKASGLTYQVNVYSFADSDGDGIGDFKGIENHLDYLDKLGVTALWLSPCQTAQSYHGYDVTDYTQLNPEYASGPHTSAQAEADFQHLIATAHAHNIRIYMDYVINHTGDQHLWFNDVKQNGPASQYWNYYALSQNPQYDVPHGNIPQIPSGSTYNSGEWWPALVGAGLSTKRYAIDLDWTNASAPSFTVSETTEAVTGTVGTQSNPARYLFWGNGTYTQFADNGTNKYRLVLDYLSDWGCLVRTTTSNDWSSGTKWGFNATEQLSLNTPHTLYSGNSDDVKNILMPDGALYYYYSAFNTGAFADINYGSSSSCESSPAFQAIVTSTYKWLEMGVDGFRLDAVKHVYVSQSDNITFWQKFYNAVNTKYKAVRSTSADIFMVGEVLSGSTECLPYYQGLPAIFDFQFWWDLKVVLNSDKKGSFVTNLEQRYRYDIFNQRSSAIATPKLSNHDEDRTAKDLYEMHRIRQAAAVLLTVPGHPFIYQGEELGYWGDRSNGDEYVRTPILWTTNQSSAAAGKLSGKVDWDMLSPSISVASQAANDESLLMLYRRFAYARNTNPALANGWIEADNKTNTNNEGCSYNDGILAWYMHEIGGDKVCLVMHNITGETQFIQRWDGDNVSNNNILVASDPVWVRGKEVQLPPYGSVVFALN